MVPKLPPKGVGPVKWREGPLRGAAWNEHSVPSGWGLVLCGDALRSRRKGTGGFRGEVEEEVSLGIAGGNRQRSSSPSRDRAKGRARCWLGYAFEGY